ncbi:MAG TPA: hypothetical protein PKG96_04490 [Bacilli bacterium]|nr:hypothetical protein [Bacilli bacterium]
MENKPYFIFGPLNEISTTHGMVSMAALHNVMHNNQMTDDLKIFGFFVQDTLDSIYETVNVVSDCYKIRFISNGMGPVDIWVHPNQVFQIFDPTYQNAQYIKASHLEPGIVVASVAGGMLVESVELLEDYSMIKMTMMNKYPSMIVGGILVFQTSDKEDKDIFFVV